MTGSHNVGAEGARVLRQEAAARYQPDRIDLLLVGEAPPRNLEHYFYFENVPVNDDLFRHVVRCVLGLEPTRENKAELLTRLSQAGVFLIELKQEPVIFGDRADLADHVEGLVS